MPWTEADRLLYKAKTTKYATDLTDEEFALLEPLFPSPKKRGRRRHSFRTILNAIFYQVRTGCQWRLRHLAVDTLGLPIVIQITAANVQDRDQLAPILAEVHRRNPWVTIAFVDGGYNGNEALRAAFEASKIACTIVKRTDKQVKDFIVLPKRWVVERTFGWLNLARRLAKDFERSTDSARTWLQFALTAILLRRIARPTKAPA